MRVTAEVRWFWREAAPPAFEAWFRDPRVHDAPLLDADERTDEYAHEPGQTELGLKARDGSLEGKGLVMLLSDLDERPFSGPIELWCKWTTEAAALSAPTVRVDKHRWLRFFDTTGARPRDVRVRSADPKQLPERGCHVELSRVVIPEEEPWWTFAFEAFMNEPLADAPMILERDLKRVAALLASRRPPPLEGALVASVPAWLAARNE